MIRLSSFALVFALLGSALSQAEVLVTFTSDPPQAMLSVAAGSGAAVEIGRTPIQVRMQAGAVYQIRLVAIEPNSTYDLYRPYSAPFTAPGEAATVSVWIDRTTAAEQQAQRAARTSALPVNIMPTNSSRTCCRVCTTGKPCGNSCISRSYTCRQPPGCAC